MCLPICEYELFPLREPLRHARPGTQPPQAPCAAQLYDEHYAPEHFPGDHTPGELDPAHITHWHWPLIGHQGWPLIGWYLNCACAELTVSSSRPSSSATSACCWLSWPGEQVNKLSTLDMSLVEYPSQRCFSPIFFKALPMLLSFSERT